MTRFPYTIVPLWLLALILCLPHWGAAQPPSPLNSPDEVTLNTGNADPLGLNAVEDDTWLAPEDNAAYYGLLNKASTTNPQALNEAAHGFTNRRRDESHEPTFADMLHHPQAFRGQPVFLRGHVLQTVRYEAQANPYGITELYECELFTPDSQGHPTTVVFLKKPEALPLGSQLVDRVEVNGYFLKLYHYPSADQITRKAPLILANTLTVRPLPANSSWLSVEAAVAVVLAVSFLLLLGWWKLGRADRHRWAQWKSRQHETEPPRFENLH